MRYISSVLITGVLGLTAAALVPGAAAQAAIACDGTVVNIRHSIIKGDSSMDKFLAAVEAQRAWYVSHGLTEDRIYVSTIVSREHPGTPSNSEILTYHYYPAKTVASPAHDAAWDAYVKMFSDSSTIKETYLTCMPKEMVK